MSDPASSTPAKLTIEIQPTTVALVKLPISARPFAELSDALRRAYGDKLTVMESPRGWMNICNPETPAAEVQ